MEWSDLRAGDAQGMPNIVSHSRIRGQRGASLIQMLWVTGTFAVLSAVAFPQLATPTRAAAVTTAENTRANIMKMWAKFRPPAHWIVRTRTQVSRSSSVKMAEQENSGDSPIGFVVYGP